MNTPLRVLISMTEKDLGSHGLEAARLIRRGCQRRADVRIMHEFGYYDGTISRKLRREVKECDVVIHIVGKRYGSAPKVEQYVSRAGYACSYTQLEYWLAKDFKKKVFVILCGNEFPYDPVALEEGVREKGIQIDHRRFLENQDHETFRVETVSLLQSTVHFISQSLLLGIADKWEQKYKFLKAVSFSAIAVMASSFLVFNTTSSVTKTTTIPSEPTKPTSYSAAPNEVNVVASSSPHGVIGTPKPQQKTPEQHNN
ncbi:MAG: DUF4062 domain-containing protein [Prosthecobacter sp.]